MPERTAYRKNNGVKVECSRDRGEVGGRKLAEKSETGEQFCSVEAMLCGCVGMNMGGSASLSDRRQEVTRVLMWETTAVVGLPYINIDWANGK